MSPWQNLDPYRPLDGSDPRYVARPAQLGSDIVAALQSGMGGGRIAINGPAGVGKSTELAAAELRLQGAEPVVRVVLDTQMDLQKLEEAELIVVLLQSLMGMQNASVDSHLHHVQTELSRNRSPDYKGKVSDLSLQFKDSFRQLLLSLAEQRRSPTFLIDGLEKADDNNVQKALVALAEAAMGTPTRLVIVLSPTSVVGPLAHDLLRLYKPLELRPIDVHVESGRQFFRDLLEKRLEMTLETLDGLTQLAIGQAISASGGIPRIFLQLLQDAAGYAALADRDELSLLDVCQAMDDHMDSLRYLLIKGDAEALQQAENTAGTELELERRARFLAHGLMLLQGRGADTRLIMHPLVKRLFQNR